MNLLQINQRRPSLLRISYRYQLAEGKWRPLCLALWCHSTASRHPKPNLCSSAHASLPVALRWGNPAGGREKVSYFALRFRCIVYEINQTKFFLILKRKNSTAPFHNPTCKSLGQMIFDLPKLQASTVIRHRWRMKRTKRGILNWRSICHPPEGWRTRSSRTGSASLQTTTCRIARAAPGIQWTRTRASSSPTISAEELCYKGDGCCANQNIC